MMLNVPEGPRRHPGAAARRCGAGNLGIERRCVVAVNLIIEEQTVRDLIPRLKAARAGIVEYPLNESL